MSTMRTTEDLRHKYRAMTKLWWLAHKFQLRRHLHADLDKSKLETDWKTGKRRQPLDVSIDGGRNMTWAHCMEKECHPSVPRRTIPYNRHCGQPLPIKSTASRVECDCFLLPTGRALNKTRTLPSSWSARSRS